MRMLVGFFMLTGTLALAQGNVTGAFSNGRLWNSLTAREKRIYLLGHGEEAVMFANEPAPDGDGTEKEGEYFPRSLKYPEVIASLDDFYRLPENLNIPIRYALRVTAMKVAGKPDDIVQSEVLFLRCFDDYMIRAGEKAPPLEDSQNAARKCVEISKTVLSPKPSEPR